MSDEHHGVEFTDPPITKVQASRQHWESVAAALKDSPDQWGKVGTFSPGIATAIRRGKYRAFLEGRGDIDPQAWMRMHWVVRTSKADSRMRDHVFMKWIP